MKNTRYYLLSIVALLSFPFYILTAIYMAFHIEIERSSPIYDMWNEYSVVAITVLWIAYDIFAVIFCKMRSESIKPFIIAIIGLILMMIFTSIFFYMLHLAWYV